MIVKIIERPTGDERLIVTRRSDGHYTFCKQFLAKGEWTNHGPDLGIYPDAETAETEAISRFP